MSLITIYYHKIQEMDNYADSISSTSRVSSCVWICLLINNQLHLCKVLFKVTSYSNENSDDKRETVS